MARSSVRVAVTTPAAIRRALAILDLPRIAADGDCLYVSSLVAECLPGARKISVDGWVDPENHVLGWLHQAVMYADYVVDATATQFNPTLPRIVIQRPGDYIKTMKRATGVAHVTYDFFTGGAVV